MKSMMKLIAVGAAFCGCMAHATTLYYKSGTASTESSWRTDAALTVTATAAPVTGDDIVFTSGSGSMTWDLNDVVPASWTQQAGYTGTVTFQTGRKNGTSNTLYGYTEDSGETRILKISGNCTLLGGTWTHTTQPDTGAATRARTSGEGVYRLIADIGGDLQVENTTFNVVGGGFKKDQGTASIDASNCSGTHAGVGGWHNNSQTFGKQGPCYGSFREPITIGSAGGTTLGGGSIQLKIAGALTIGESVTFNAAGVKNNSGYYTGAGGSVFITAATITGGGTFTARGGQANSYGGGGGGGRIAIILTGDGADFSNFTGTYTTHSWYGGGGINMGYGGTTYFETKADGAGGGVLVVDGVTGRDWTVEPQRVECFSTLLSVDDCAYSPKKIILRDAATLGVPAGVTFRIRATESQDSLVTTLPNQIRSYGATFAFDNETPSVMTNVSLHLFYPTTVRVGANGTGTLTLDGGLIECDTNATVQGSVVVADKGQITHTRGVSFSAPKSGNPPVSPWPTMNLTVTGSMTVDAGGELTAVNKGNNPVLNGVQTAVHAGRAHGRGSNAYPFGSLTRPVTYGNGTSWGSDTSPYSNGVPYGIGGGAIRVTVLGELTINGKVTADGASSWHNNTNYGSSAGGSIWLTAATLSGSGSISADGGIAELQYNINNGCGSGGRVAVYLTDPSATFDDFTGTITAHPGHVKNKTVAIPAVRARARSI